MKYIKTNRTYYKLLDSRGNVFYNSGGISCLYTFTEGSINPKAHTFIMYCPVQHLRYNDTLMNRWIEELNENGFPCKYMGINNDEQVEVSVTMSAFNNSRVYLLSTLMLIRCLMEQGINEVPEHYFALIEQGMDKFLALQMAHKKVKYMNSNHTITSKQSKIELTKEEFFEQLKARPDPFDRPKRQCISYFWNKFKDYEYR